MLRCRFYLNWFSAQFSEQQRLFSLADGVFRERATSSRQATPIRNLCGSREFVERSRADCAATGWNDEASETKRDSNPASVAATSGPVMTRCGLEPANEVVPRLAPPFLFIAQPKRIAVVETPLTGSPIF